MPFVWGSCVVSYFLYIYIYFWVFVLITLYAIINGCGIFTPNQRSSPESLEWKHWSKTLDYQITNPREYQIVRTHTKETNWIQDPESPNHPVQVDSSNFSSIQFSLVAQSCPTFAIPWTATWQFSLSITNSQSWPKLMSIELMMPSKPLIRCRPLLSLPSVSIRVLSNESALHIRWQKYWNFSFNISPSNEHTGLIFRINWLDPLAVQGALKSLFQHHSSKVSILWHTAFFMVQLSHPYMTTWRGKKNSLD